MEVNRMTYIAYFENLRDQLRLLGTWGTNCTHRINRSDATLKAGGSNDPPNLEKRKFIYIILKKKI